MEGDRAVITKTFCQVSKDPRHSDIVLVSFEPVTERIFDSWSMAFAGKSEQAMDLYIRFGIAEEFSPSKMTADSLLSFICELSKLEEHVARFTPDKVAV